MRKAAALFIWLSFLALAAPAQAATAPRQPIVVELYTSQGCLACAAADQRVGELAERKDVLVLSFSVDYWDVFGWRDTFAKPIFTERQRDYAARFGRTAVSDGTPVTPQVIIQGRWQVAGGDEDDLVAAMTTATRTRLDPPDMRLTAKTVSIGSGRATKANVWLVRYDPRDQTTTVRRGETRGQVFHQRNVVVQLVRLGGWTGGRKTLTLPAAEDSDLATAVIVQAVEGGRIIGAIAGPVAAAK